MNIDFFDIQSRCSQSPEQNNFLKVLHMKHCSAIYALAFVFTFFLAGNISGATFVVTNTNDNGVGSLRQAILDSQNNNADDVINFDPATFNTPKTITLTNGEIRILADNSAGPVTGITINGPGAHLLTISGNNQSRITSVAWMAKLAIHGVKLTGGNGVGVVTTWQGNGGAIMVEPAFLGAGIYNLTITNSVITGNSAIRGGGIFDTGYTALITNTTIHNNTASDDAGGLLSERLNCVNCTITGNSALDDGGGLFINTFGTATLTNSTIVNNTAPQGGGIAGSTNFDQRGTLHARNNIIANNPSPGSQGSDMQFIIYQSFAPNIVHNVCCNIQPPATDLINVDPKLEAQMRTNSVGVPYFALRGTDSPAIDRGNNCVLIPMASGGCVSDVVVTDIRGTSRPQDGDGNGNAVIDLGTFEISASEFTMTPGRLDLIAADDSGVSDTDNITTKRDLHFQLGGLINGATVQIFRNGAQVQSFTATGTSANITDLNLPADGVFSYAARQVSGGVESLFGAALDVTVDNTRPGSTLYRPPFQPDPTRELPIRFVIGFNETVYGFTGSDISLASSTAGVSGATLTIVAAAPQYVIWISGVTTSGQVTATMAENQVTDAAGNPNWNSSYSDNSVAYDRSGPIVTVNQAASQPDPAVSRPINFTVSFDESVTGFTVSDVVLTGSTADVSAATIVLTGSGLTYNVAVGNVNSSGTVRASIPANRVQDSLGNSNGASVSTDNTVTYNRKTAQFDYDGDGKADVSVFRPSDGNWYLLQSQGGFSVQGFGLSGDVLTPADYDGDGKTDLGIFRPSTGMWWYKSTANNGYYAVQWGASGDIPLAQDFDGDGKSDFVFYRPSDSTWYRLGSTGVYSPLLFGTAGDIPVVADMDGDGKADPTVYRPSTGTWWYASSVNGGYYALQWGTATDIPVTGDFDGDGKTDPAYFRPSDGAWFILYSGAGYSTFVVTSWGVAGDRPVAGDYDGDGKTDLAVYRPSNSMWFVMRSTQGFYSANFGIGGDRPTPAAFVP